MDINISEIVTEIVRRYNFLGSVFASLEIVPDYNCYNYQGYPSLSASKKRISYHPDFLSTLNREQQIFAFAHEACHILLKHIDRATGKNPELWNTAADAIINAQLKRDHFELIDGCVDRIDALNYSTEKYYQKLLEEKEYQEDNKNQSSDNSSSNGNDEQNSKNNNSSSNTKTENNDNKNQSSDNSSSNGNDEQTSKNNDNTDSNAETDQNGSKNQSSGNSSSNGNDGQTSKNNNTDSNPETEDYKKYDVGHDTHSNWYTEEKELEENEKSSSNSSDSKNSNQTDNEKEFDDTKVFRENRKKEKERLENLRNEIVKRMLGAGNDTNSDILQFNSIGDKTNLIKWQRLLMDATKIEEDWSFLNATIEYGVVTPHLEEQPQPETEIIIDTSGSVSNNLVRNFLRECKSLLKTSKIRVGCFDSKFYGFQDIRSEEDIDNFTITGRGGTDFNIAVEAFTGKAENKIIFTDGDASMPSKELNAIWIVYGPFKINPKGGKVIYISEEQLQELNIISENSQKRR